MSILSTVNRDRTSQNLTIHLGKWAVCPAGLQDGRIWVETVGVDYGDLFRRHIAERSVRVPGPDRTTSDDCVMPDALRSSTNNELLP